MKQIKKIALVAVLTILGLQVNAQDNNTDNHNITIGIPNVALLDLETSGTRNFNANFVQPTPLEAGEKLNAPASNSDLWLNYSSILTSTITTRRVQVKASALVDGVDIAVVAAAATTGAGTRGTPTAAVTLTAADQNLITGIGSAYTATGASNGHRLTYTFTSPDSKYADLRESSTTITVTYTLVDN